MKIKTEMRSFTDQKYSEKCKTFFKTKKGEYGYGDQFLGIKTPPLRILAKKYVELRFSDVQKLIKSKYHEERLLGLLILVYKYQKAKTSDDQEQIFQMYIANLKYINNWDLVDVTCPHIVGKHLMERDRAILYVWARSDDLWTKRIAMITNWWFVRNGDLRDVFKISKILLNDDHDLIHKAVGWMLREAAKKDYLKAEKFLLKHYKEMPRTMLRYAIEKFPEAQRQKFLKGTV